MFVETITNKKRLRSEFIGSLIIQNKSKYVAEIGVSSGDNARNILRFLNKNNWFLEKFYLIDLPEKEKNIIYAYRPESLEAMPEVKYIDCGSLTASKEFENESLNLIFIDGDHSKKGFLNDMEAWTPKLKEDGILCGDEYQCPIGHSCYYRAELFKKIFSKIYIVPEHRKSEGHQTWLWWAKKENIRYDYS